MSQVTVHDRSSRSLLASARRFCDIIYALMMHDIKNRLFGSGWGQIVMVIWPLAHIAILISVYLLTKRQYPYGESIIQFSAVSIYPFIIFNYVSRWIVFSAITNKSFLSYPIIRPFDIILSRALLELVSVTIVGIALLIFVAVCGYSILPNDPAQAVYAVLATMFLAVSVGFLNAPVAFIMPIWGLVIALVNIVAWICSGVAFTVSTLPAEIRTPLSYNPLLQCVEWFRSAYYGDYPTLVLDRTYVLEFSLVTFTCGILLNKILRRLY